jgi:hypothetical protein
MPTTILRSQTARLNGAKSHGPKTPEGRARSALNSTRHGLTSARTLLNTESEAEFQTFRASYFRELAPRNQLEADLVEQLVAARWRLQRISSIETALLNVELVKQEPRFREEFTGLDDDCRLALAFRTLCDESRALEVLNRYEARHERTCIKVLETLAMLREILPNEPKRAANTKVFAAITAPRTVRRTRTDPAPLSSPAALAPKPGLRPLSGLTPAGNSELPS